MFFLDNAHNSQSNVNLGLKKKWANEGNPVEICWNKPDKRIPLTQKTPSQTFFLVDVFLGIFSGNRSRLIVTTAL